MVNVESIVKALAQLSLLNFFPRETEARGALVELVCRKAQSEEQVKWAVMKLLQRYQEWPGPAAFLALFDSPMMPGNMKPLSAADRQKVLGTGEQKLITDGSAPDPTLEQDMRTTLGAVAGLRSLGFVAPATKEEIAAAPSWLKKLEGYE